MILIFPPTKAGQLAALSVPSPNNMFFSFGVFEVRTGIDYVPIPLQGQDVLDKIYAVNYSKLAALSAMTPAQVIVWVDANVTTLPEARDAIKTLAIAVSILSRTL